MKTKKVVLSQHVIAEDERTEVYRFWKHFFSHKDFSEMLLPHEIFYDPSDYLCSDKYANKLNFLKYFIIVNLIFPRVIKRVEKLRATCSTGLCA